ncbi:zinc finger CCHC-type and RNA-binding motif-containing protein 1-like isoform X1 [Haliotis rufescens]|uniref:zinc finger CCHC-type and RNA-binding motif-containing protein 1-like isoform X1 n=1 Tax=Haliotis rufescens TaxID=6454 RepID=UPI001EB06F5B|nr:zinc finger CCHC-type and RNA-binding motif-containing protein 1-like isoform X1 [Haliotis rufescens]
MIIMSGGLAPSRSTIYVSNLPFSLTNNDMHKIFAKYGKVVKVTVMKDKDTRRSKGVAFVLYLERDSAHKAVRSLNKSQMFGRTIKCSIAKDNGRTTEFIKKKTYKDKSRCYECGDEGHLSYQCPKNLLGDREPPEKKKKKQNEEDEEDEEDSDKGDNQTEDSLSAAIRYQHQKHNEESGQYPFPYLDDAEEEPKRKKYKKDSYFSDEEELSDND